MQSHARLSSPDQAGTDYMNCPVNSQNFKKLMFVIRYNVIGWFLTYQKLTDTYHGQSHAITILHSVVTKEVTSTIKSSSYSYSTGQQSMLCFPFKIPHSQEHLRVLKRRASCVLADYLF